MFFNKPQAVRFKVESERPAVSAPLATKFGILLMVSVGLFQASGGLDKLLELVAANRMGDWASARQSEDVAVRCDARNAWRVQAGKWAAARAVR